MSKAILVMDMPSSCNECELKVLPNPYSFMICGKTKEHIERGSQRPTWCPLREVPPRAYHPNFCDNGRFDAGYNACIDEILGGGE